MDKVAFLEFLSTAKNEGASGVLVASLIKQSTGEDVDPQQLEALMAQMPQGGAPGGDPAAGGGAPAPHPHGHEGHGGGELPLSEEQINEIAMLIAQHLQEQEAAAGGAGAAGPEGGAPAPTGMEGLPPEHQQEFQNMKSAEYISEFIKRGSEWGLSVDDSVNLYSESLGNLTNILKEASDRNIGAMSVAASLDEPTLAYFQGIGEKAASENWTYDQTLEALHAAGYGDQLKEKFTSNK